MDPSYLLPDAGIETLLYKAGNLKTDDSKKSGEARRHQPLTLLWALGRAIRGEEHLVPWATTRREIGDLIKRFGLEDDRDTPWYPIVKLTRVGLWEIPGHPKPPPAHGNEPRKWMQERQPLSGLAQWVYDIVTTHEDVRAQVATMLLGKYFKDVDHNALLDRVGLSMTDAPIPEGTHSSERPVG